MSTFTVKIDCDNAAFGDSDFERSQELGRLLRKIAAQVENEQEGFFSWANIYDANGNEVGRFAYKDHPNQGLRLK